MSSPEPSISAPWLMEARNPNDRVPISWKEKEKTMSRRRLGLGWMTVVVIAVMMMVAGAPYGLANEGTETRSAPPKRRKGYVR